MLDNNDDEEVDGEFGTPIERKVRTRRGNKYSYSLPTTEPGGITSLRCITANPRFRGRSLPWDKPSSRRVCLERSEHAMTSDLALCDASELDAPASARYAGRNCPLRQ